MELDGFISFSLKGFAANSPVLQSVIELNTTTIVCHDGVN